MTGTPHSDPPTVGTGLPATSEQRLLELRTRIAEAIGAPAPVDGDATLGDLGVTSLRTAVVLAGVWRDWGVRLSLTDLGPSSTARAVAALVEQLTAAP